MEISIDFEAMHGVAPAVGAVLPGAAKPLSLTDAPRSAGA
jgi:hypothetical protein